MKKILGIGLSGIGIVTVIVTIILKLKRQMSISIIGGADGPTSVFIAKNNKTSRPQIANSIDISDYTTIFVGFPVWWYTAPHIINTFLESHDFSDKTIIPFCTSGGSDLSNAPRDMAKSAPSAIFKTGRRFNFGESKGSIRKWLETLKIELD